MPAFERAQLPFVDLSTAHITPEDTQLLKREFEAWPEGQLSVWMHPEYGFFLYVPDEPELGEEFDSWGFSEGFWSLLKELRRQDVDYVRLDRDASESPDLPTFDWSGEEIDASAEEIP